MHKSMQTRRSRSPSFFVILSRVSEIIVKDRQTYDRFRELTVTDRRTDGQTDGRKQVFLERLRLYKL